MSKVLTLIIAFVLFTMSSAIAQSQPELFTDPANPNPNEPFLAVLYLPLGGCTVEETFEFSQVGSTLTVSQLLPFGAAVNAGTCFETYQMAALPQGEYTLVWRYVIAGIPGYSASTNFAVGVPPSAPPVPVPSSNVWMLVFLSLAVAACVAYRKFA